MYNKKLEKWTEKVINTDTIELNDEMIAKATETFEGLTKQELIEKILALEFNKLYKKVEKDDLNISLNERRDDRGGRDGRRDDRRDDRGRDGRRDERGSRDERSSRDERPAGKAFHSNPHMDTFFVNIGKIDNIHPGILIDILAGHAGLNKKQIGNIDIQKRHCLVEIDKKFSKIMDSSKILKYRGRRITIKKEDFK
ncbi:MAG: DbpA RNA binding domain-containing protein [Saprospiraceae bacterium]|nr:DbpA RNA binding domain-containing protein [Saprospiraceae bacterium]